MIRRLSSVLLQDIVSQEQGMSEGESEGGERERGGMNGRRQHGKRNAGRER